MFMNIFLGTKFTDITAKGNHVWAVDDKGNLFSRIVISSSNIQGNYWLSGIMVSDYLIYNFVCKT